MKKSKIIADMNKGFTNEELAITEKYRLPLPSNVFIETLKDGDVVNEVLHKSGEINKEFGRAKGHLSTSKSAQHSCIRWRNVIQKYRKRIGVIEEGKRH